MCREYTWAEQNRQRTCISVYSTYWCVILLCTALTFFFAEKIKVSKKDWSKVNAARLQKYSHYYDIMYGKNIKPENLGTRESFADIAATILDYFKMTKPFAGESML